MNQNRCINDGLVVPDDGFCANYNAYYSQWNTRDHGSGPEEPESMEGRIDLAEALSDISQIKSSDLRQEAMEALVQGLAKRLVRLEEYAIRTAERGSIPCREVIANIMADKP